MTMFLTHEIIFQNNSRNEEVELLLRLMNSSEKFNIRQCEVNFDVSV